MINEEFERLKQLIREAEQNRYATKEPAIEEPAERRKLDRDMDRLERALKKIVSAPRNTWSIEGERCAEFRRVSEQRQAEIREIGKRSDAKIKALMEETQKKNQQRPLS